MAMVTKVIDINAPLTPEQIAELEHAKQMPVVYDEDCPPLTDQDLAKFAQLAIKQRKARRKKLISLRVSENLVERAQKLGAGYTGVLSRLLEMAFDNPEMLKKCL